MWKEWKVWKVWGTPEPEPEPEPVTVFRFQNLDPPDEIQDARCKGPCVAQFEIRNSKFESAAQILRLESSGLAQVAAAGGRE